MKIKFNVFIVSVFILFFVVDISAQNLEQSEWKGFKRINFEVENCNARLVIPKKALNGNPWVWRARFPEYHNKIDSSLVAEGFHIAYINTDNKFGSPNAVKIWNKFYKYLVKNYKLQKKVAIHCHSRGGLFAYNWAKVNPEKVACIYADAIVCDFKSWPAGFGAGDGSKNEWKRLKQEYGFKNDEEAIAYLNNPIDNLEELAKNRVPILHSISNQDKIVPPKENSLKLIQRYIELDAPASILPCSKGIQKLKGHHYEIDNPQLVIDFIKYNSIQKGKLNSSNYHLERKGIANSYIKFEREKVGRVAFLGGSITYNTGWRDSISAYLVKRFPQTKFEFVAAGIPSMGSTPGAFRLQRDVLSKGKIDLLFEEAAVNDSTNERTSEEQIKGMEGIVRHLRKTNPEMDIVMMHFVDPDKMEDYRRGVEPEVITNHNLIADHYGISTINLAKEVTDRIDNGEFTWEKDFKNLHPSPFGQGIYAHSMLQFLENSFSKHLDADDKIFSYDLQEKINEFSYENGELVDISTIKLPKGWFINSSWNPNDGKRTRPNYVDVPMLIGDKPSKVLKFKFEGNTVGIAIAAGKDAGIIEYRIDKGEWKTQNLFTKWSGQVHLPWYYTLASELSNKKHTLEIKISEIKDARSEGNACRIRYFYINKN
ncbi:sialidase-1 [Lutibacter oricola]|uniref:Sialidase-1 n=1 Tax=Lutibacter oricola TaxID=762486 RepID=A0A1H3FDB7_9FLAO|nr:GDSL-type esterase/lipase family protein [Lutibacter oricola]SDX88777.1 sialidase-1 [Lutibacter oricola]